MINGSLSFQEYPNNHVLDQDFFAYAILAVVH